MNFLKKKQRNFAFGGGGILNYASREILFLQNRTTQDLHV